MNAAAASRGAVLAWLLLAAASPEAAEAGEATRSPFAAPGASPVVAWAGGIAALAVAAGLLVVRTGRARASARARERADADEPFNLIQLVHTVAASSWQTGGRLAQPVEVAVSPAVPRLLVGPVPQLRQVIRAVIDHLARSVQPGPVRLTVWRQAAVPGRTEVMFAFSVEDPSGAARQGSAFTAWFRRARGAWRIRRSGLARTADLARAIGGRLWCDDDPGSDGGFLLCVPLAIAPAGAWTAPAPATTAATRRALVISDRDHGAIPVALMLSNLGFAVERAGNSLRALMFAGARKYDVVALECDRLGPAALDLVRSLRERPFASADSLFLTIVSDNSSAIRKQHRAAGANAIFTPPFTMARLRQSLALATVPSAAPPAAPEPADALDHLRAGAADRQVSLVEEIARFFGVAEQDLRRLEQALQQENADLAHRAAHDLCGLCLLVHASAEVGTLHHIRQAVEHDRWAEARERRSHLADQLAGLRVTLVSRAQAAPPG